ARPGVDLAATAGCRNTNGDSLEFEVLYARTLSGPHRQDPYRLGLCAPVLPLLAREWHSQTGGRNLPASCDRTCACRHKSRQVLLRWQRHALRLLCLVEGG